MNSLKAARRKRPVLKIVLISLFVVLSVSALLIYQNYNRLLADALLKTFNSSVVSDVYELKFEKLRVNFIEGSVRVVNVTLQPRKNPLKHYAYINSSLRLNAEKLTLEKVDIVALLKSNQLHVERITITKPDIDIHLNGDSYALFPFNDSTSVTKNQKKSIAAFALKEFQLIDASFHSANSNKQREFSIQQLNISLHHLQITPLHQEYITSFSRVTLAIGVFNSKMQKGPIQQFSFNDFAIGIDSLETKTTLDTMTYRFHNFNAGIHDVDIQTADSLFHVTMKALDVSYGQKSIALKAVSFKPNVSHAALQKKYRFQHAEFSGTVGSLDLVDMNFDSLFFAKKIFIDEVLVDNVVASVFKDKTKPLDTTRFPAYVGQSIADIPLPLRINHLKATHIQLNSTERIPNGTHAQVMISKGTVDVKNITNLAPNSALTVDADAYVNKKAHFKASLKFPYAKPEFDFEGVVWKFNLPDLNALIQAYTPAKINRGKLDQLSFAGHAEKTKASGTLRFLYHDLEVDIELPEQARWKNAVLAFAANTVLTSSNPAEAELPPRIVHFAIQRDMNKGFVNVLIKSILNGLKETMIMSKENRKSYQNAKKKKAAG